MPSVYGQSVQKSSINTDIQTATSAQSNAEGTLTLVDNHFLLSILSLTTTNDNILKQSSILCQFQ